MKNCFGALFFALFASALGAQEVVKIGAILPISGDMAHIGTPIAKAIKMFRNDCQTHTYRHRYEVLLEDDQFIRSKTAQAAQKLINIDHVDALAYIGSGSGNVLKPRISAAQIPGIGWVSDTSVADGQYSFIHCTQPEEEAIVLGDIAEALGVKSAAFLTMKNQATLAFQKAAEAEFKKRGIAVVFSESFSPGERDFRVVLLRAREAKPELFVPLSMSPEMEIILRQRKQIGLSCPVSSIESLDAIADFTDAEGCFYASVGGATPEFAARVERELGEMPRWGAPYFYDILCLIRAAYESSPTADRAEATAWLRQFKDFPSALGSLTMDARGFVRSPAGLYKIEGGKSRQATIEEVKAVRK